MLCEKESSEGDGAARYSIAEASRRTGYSVDTLRYYEKEGLLLGVGRGRGGRRAYSDADLRTLSLVTCLKKTGMPLRDIRAYMELTTRGESTVPRRLDLLRRQLESVRRMRAEFDRYESRLAFKIWYYETARRVGLAALGDDFDALLARYRRETGRDAAF